MGPDILATLWELTQRFGLILAICFVLMQMRSFRKVLSHSSTPREKAFVAVLFGFFGVIGTHEMYMTTLDACPNLRAMAVVTAGILEGPLVGLGAALIAAGHRVFIGGFSSLPCILATLTEGVAAGIAVRHLHLNKLNWKTGFIICACGEAFHMLLVLIMSKPFEKALSLVEVIAVPMILVNSIGVAIVLMIVTLVLKSEEKIGAYQAQKALKIATKTVGYLRTGLNEETAAQTVKIIHSMMDYVAVAITDSTRILAYQGKGADHHYRANTDILPMTRKVIDTGRVMILPDRASIACSVSACPLESGLIVPLTKKDDIVGTLALYRGRDSVMTQVDIEMARGLAKLFAIQLELEEIQQNARRLDRAEIAALQAQINPHFFFNALNTIVSFCRTDVEKARELLIHLGTFFRSTLRDRRSDLISLERELENIRSYLFIEKARFGDSIAVEYSLHHSGSEWFVPPFTLQPLIENSIRHGFAHRGNGHGRVSIETWEEDNMLRITIDDNGVGIPPEKVKRVLDGDDSVADNGGIALKNINDRLVHLYGVGYGLSIESEEGRGTKVFLTIPRESVSIR